MGARKSKPSCQNCHQFLRVDGKPACTNIQQKPGKKPYRFLKSLVICSLQEYWPNREVRARMGALGR